MKPGTKPDCACNIRKCFCGGTLVKMTEQEITDYKELSRQQSADRAKSAREESILPKWCLAAIANRAYEDGHSAGQQEVDGIESGMIGDFEEYMRKEQKT